MTEEQKTELLDWVSACQSAYHIENTPGHRFGGIGGQLQENREALVDYVQSLLDAPSSAALDAKWGAVHTVGDMVRNLLTLDQGAPIFAAFHTDYQGERRCRTRPVSTSWERVIDGKWVDSSRKDVPYAVIVWAKQDERPGAGSQD